MEKINLKNGITAPYISSRTNSLTIYLAKLETKKNRDASETFLCEGEKLFFEAEEYGDVASVSLSEEKLYYLSDEVYKKLKDLSGRGVGVNVFSSSAFSKISTEKSPQGIITEVKYLEKCFKIEESEKTAEYVGDKSVLILDSIRDPGNLGTILRSAAAFGIDLVLMYSCADIYNTKTIRAAMGAVFKLELPVTDDLPSSIESLKKSGRRVLASSVRDGALILGEFEILKTDCVVLGNEGHGISENIIDACSSVVTIPMRAETESLNASAAAAAILWEYARSRNT